MFRIILAGLRRRRRRAVALVVGILVATTGFTVLTSSTQASKLTVTEAVDRNARGAYDILVRPSGSQSALEKQRGLVAPNFLAGDFGGISLDQWHRIEGIDGVDIAAPVANLGYVPVPTAVTVDLTARVRPDLTTQVLEIAPTWTTDRGLTVAPDTAVHYVYVTSRPVVWAVDDAGAAWHWSDHKDRRGATRCDGHWKQLNYAQPLHPAAIEIEPDGTERMLCANDQQPTFSDTPQTDPRITVVHRRPDGRFDTKGDIEARLTYNIDYLVFLMMSAIDPVAESRLVGLNGAVVSGRSLDPHETATVTTGPEADDTRLPVLASTTPYIDASLSIAVSRLNVPVGADVATPSWVEGAEPAIPPVLRDAPATVVATVTSDADAQYRAALANPDYFAGVGDALMFSQPKVDVNALGQLAPQPVMITALQAVDSVQNSYGVTAPTFVADTPARTVTSLVPHNGSATADRFPDDRTLMDAIGAQGVLVGEYDPAKLAGFSDLSAVSMETYQSPELPGADAPSRKALGDKPLIPSGNPGAYLSSPPLLLTTLDALPVLKIKNPISAVRVRLAGHLGVDPVSRERVRLAAQRIHDATGLDVDITVGASPAPQKLALPSGSLGRPALLLTERWTKKGVAVAILRAIDRKSVVLFGLILIVCLLFLLNAVTAAVRERRRELAILACLGWPRLRLAALIGGETALLGLLAGAVSAALSIPVAALAHITLGTTHALLAVPVGVCLAVVAAAGPAWRASLVTAASALEPGARPARRRRTGRRRTVAGLALTNLARTPGRTALAAVALAVGVASVTMLLAVTVAFHGAVTGTLLGDAVSLQVRTVDEVAVAAIVLLGLVAVADVLYLGITERASEFATLRATGWSETAIARLVTTEGIGIGVFGALLGAGVGIGAAIGFSGSLPSALSLYTALVALAGVVAAGLTALAPALLGGRMSMSTPLAEE